MFDLADLDDLNRAGALAAAVQARCGADAAEAKLLRIAAHWADLHPVTTSEAADGIAVSGMERLMPLAGEGTPPVAEFAPAELAAALGISSYAGQLLIGDALELRHRLPRLWAAILDGRLQAWRGRQIAEHTRHLNPEAAAWVDTQITPFAHKLSLGRVLKLVETALLRFQPEEAAKQAAAAADRRGVFLSDHTTSGTRSIHIEADTLDATAFDHTIDQLAKALGALGDTDLADVRRAKAVGVIADPQHALNLLTDEEDSIEVDGPGTTDSTHDTDDDTEAPSADRPADRFAESCRHQAPAGLRKPTRTKSTMRPRLVLYLHLSAVTGTNGMTVDPVGRVEGIGPVLTSQIRDWVGRGDVVIKPVIDLANHASVDAYEVPDRIRERVLLRTPCCAFPWCNNLSRNKDIDHIEPYLDPDEGGPPGQTGPDNLAPLCRRHHRLKTHSGWRYDMPEPGTYLWTSPHGQHYRVDHTGTTNL